MPKNLDVDEMAQLLEVNEDDPLSIRDRAIMELMYGAGLRLAELVSINVKDVNFSAGELRVVGKGNKERVAPFSGMAKEWLNNWLKIRGQLANADEDGLFVSKLGNRSLTEVCKTYGRVGTETSGSVILALTNCVTRLPHMYWNQK